MATPRKKDRAPRGAAKAKAETPAADEPVVAVQEIPEAEPQGKDTPEPLRREEIDEEPVKKSREFDDVPSSERSSLKVYLQEIGKVPLLKPEEEVALAGRIRKGDAAAREHMIRANLRLVVKIAHDYSNFGLPLLDLISEGNIGLMKAVERFDPNKGGKLSTYAAWWIKQSIKRALANQSKTIRLPVHLVDKISRMRKATALLQDEFGREPTNEELAREIGIPVNKVAHMKTVSTRPSSLDAPVGEDDSTELGELVRDENAATPFEDLRGKSSLQDIHALVGQLEPREAEILRLRFGLDGEAPKTLEEVGAYFKVTRERVRQLQNMALSKMRKAMQALEHQNTAEEVRDEQVAQERQKVLQEFFASHQTNGAAAR
jgi:RNA polymerase primary sigma factor